MTVEEIDQLDPVDADKIALYIVNRTRHNRDMQGIYAAGITGCMGFRWTLKEWIKVIGPEKEPLLNLDPASILILLSL